jgi:hypothetical protein
MLKVWTLIGCVLIKKLAQGSCRHVLYTLEKYRAIEVWRTRKFRY